MRFRPWNASWCMSKVLPHHILKKKKQLLGNLVFIIKIWQGKTWDMHKPAFQALKRTFMLSQMFIQQILIRKAIYKILVFFLIKIGWRRPQTWINVRFRAWNARLCLSQVFSHLILIKKQSIHKMVALSNYGEERPETCINVISQVFPHHNLVKTNFFINCFFLSKNGRGRFETCTNVRFRPWKACLCMFQVFPYRILILKKKTNFRIIFFFKLLWGKIWDLDKRAFQAAKLTFMHVSGLPTSYFDLKKTNL